MISSRTNTSTRTGVLISCTVLFVWLTGGCTSYRYVVFPTDPLRPALTNGMSQTVFRSEMEERWFGRTNNQATAKWTPQADLWELKDTPTPFQFFNCQRIMACRPSAATTSIVEVARRNTRRLSGLYGQEYAAIEKGKEGIASNAVYVGLALSGGGVRSAAFASGVLAGLHEIRVLPKVGYLSTVSGGGYAGGWYMTHAGAVSAGEGAEGMKCTPQYLFRRGGEHLQHLNQNASYLEKAHYSSRKGDLIMYGAGHALCVPVHWVANGLFDARWMLPFTRGIYRDGISRGFLYETPCRVAPDERPYVSFKMNELAPSPERPFWIVNTHLSLKDSDDHHKQRSGDAFEITPLWAGADSVGYVSNREALGGTGRYLQNVADVLTISGAAVDTHSLQENLCESLAIKAFNLDLGYDVAGFDSKFNALHHPAGALGQNVWYWITGIGQLHRLGVLSDWQHHVRWCPAANWDVFGDSMHSNSEWARKYHLSDGGHFDNLGIYALVRRGCRLIIVSDAGCDPDVSRWDSLSNYNKSMVFEDLRKLEVKLSADFGVKLTMRFDDFTAGSTNGAAGYADSPRTTIVRGRIRNLPIMGVGREDANRLYRDVSILYIKAAYANEGQLLRSCGFIDRQKAETGSFPNESTANQFFSEQKVEAYRALAREIVLAHRAVIEHAVQCATSEDHDELHSGPLPKRE